MGVGQFLGAQIGARLAISHGARIIRPLLVLVSCGMAMKLLLDPANPITNFFVIRNSRAPAHDRIMLLEQALGVAAMASIASARCCCSSTRRRMSGRGTPA